MRIDDVNRPAQPPATERTERTGEQGKKEPSSLHSADQVDISQLAHSLNSADTQRLEHLRLQVQTGTYHVQPDVVANALIDEHLKS